MTNMNTANATTTTTTAPAFTLFVEYKSGEKIRYEGVMRHPKSDSPYDFYIKLKRGLYKEVVSVHLNVDGVAKWWPVTLMHSTTVPTYVVLTYCGERILLESTNTLVPDDSRNIIGYRYETVLDKDGNAARDRYGEKIAVKAVYGELHQIKKVDIDHLHPQIKRIVEYK